VKPYDELRASALRTLIPPRIDAYDAVLDDVHALAERCYGWQVRYAKERNMLWADDLSLDDPPYPDPHYFAFRETSSLYAALMLELRRDGLGDLARELRGNYRALRAANM
jgi:hypothetical protein